MQHYIVMCLVKADPRTIARVVGVCVQRRYALESVIAIPDKAAPLNTIALVIEADDLRIMNTVQQLDKIIDVLNVELLSPSSPAVRELLLSRIGAALQAATLVPVT